MRILQICNKPPFPAVDGGAIAMNNVTQGMLNKGCSIHVLTITTPKHNININELPKNYVEKTNFQSVYIDTSIKLKDAFLNLFSNRSYNIDRFISTDFSKVLSETLKNNEFDIIIIESLFATPYIKIIKELSKAKVVLRAHNVEHRIWERISINTNNLLKKKYIDLLAKRLKSYEISIFKQLDAICAMTEVDVASFKQLGFKKKITSVPTGYILDEAKVPAKEVDELSVFHLASMDWLPNTEGVDWFMENVWTKVNSAVPNSKLYLAGREMPQKYYDLNIKSIETVGPVKSAKEFFLSKNIMVVPILSGSGMRIKIIEGMAIGKVIISTTIGAEGINCMHNKNILIADSPAEFSKAIIKCLKDKSFCDEISKNAKKLIFEEYSNETISGKMIDFFKQL
jgi:glycosyltransferase involved in cell wall biosynthesis